MTDLFNLIKQMSEFESGLLKNATAPTKFNVLKNEKDLKVELLLPGFKKEDIAIELNENKLLVKAISSRETDKSDVFIWRDFEQKNYEQLLSLPKDFEYQGIEAAYDAGILTITLKGSPRLENKTKIEIK